MMTQKRVIFVVMITGMMALAIVGCSKAEETATTTVESATFAGQITQEEHDMPEFSEHGVPDTSMTDLATIAEELGVTEEQLRDALGDTQQGLPDFTAVAEELNVSEDALRKALVFPEGDFPAGRPHGGEPPSGEPPADAD